MQRAEWCQRFPSDSGVTWYSYLTHDCLRFPSWTAYRTYANKDPFADKEWTLIRLAMSLVEEHQVLVRDLWQNDCHPTPYLCRYLLDSAVAQSEWPKKRAPTVTADGWNCAGRQDYWVVTADRLVELQSSGFKKMREFDAIVEGTHSDEEGEHDKKAATTTGSAAVTSRANARWAMSGEAPKAQRSEPLDTST